jgi:FkbM family methyltransferase
MLAEKELEFAGHKYKICYETEPPPGHVNYHPSHWSHIDEDVVRRRVWKINAGDIIFDVGAAYGSYAVTALAQGAKHVYAWSPQGHPGDPMKEIDYLKRTLALNGWEDRMTVWKESGVYSENGWFDSGNSTFAKTLNGPPSGLVMRVQSIDGLKNEDGSDFIFPEKIDWWKMDVEGAEAHVLQGAKQTIRKFRPKIAVENHNFLVPGIESQVRVILESWGYTHDHTVQHGSVSHSLYLP